MLYKFSEIIGVCVPFLAAIKTNMLIVAVSITSRANNERKIDFEVKSPKQPITINIKIGIS